MIEERKRLIYDYVNGNYIEDISKLRNDYMFMMDVINYTNDRHIYYSCSDEVKCNYEFVKFLINKFKNKKQFICYVVDKYLNNTPEDDINRFELLIIFCDILNSLGVDYKGLTYNIKKLSFYKDNICEISNLIKNGKLDNLESGLGFSYIISKYESSKVICDYFAYNYMTEIFYNNMVYRLEDLIHNCFSTKDELLNYGIYNFIINYIGCYDKVLANYLSANKKDLKKIELSILNIINNWNNYVCSNEKIRLGKENGNDFLLDVVNSNSNRFLGVKCYKKVK